MKIVALMVYYKGNIPEICSNLKAYIHNIGALVIWLNSPLEEKDKHEIIAAFKPYHSIILFRGDGTNQGLSKVYNEVAREFESQYDYLLTMDQDSWWYNFGDYIDFIEQIQEDDIIAYGPDVITDKDVIGDEKCTGIEVDEIINSGALVKLSLLSAIGYYNEELFVDAIDEELCLRAQANKLRIIKVRGSYLIQQYGHAETHRFFNRTVSITGHKPERKYQIARNHVWLIKNYHLTRERRKSYIKDYIIRPTVETILYEKNKLRKVTSIIKGVIDGLR